MNGLNDSPITMLFAVILTIGVLVWMGFWAANNILSGHEVQQARNQSALESR
jgi:hypothetical protein